MNKQAAKLAKTTALLNSTSIQLRISGKYIFGKSNKHPRFSYA
jgi:hypothetical protein